MKMLLLIALLQCTTTLLLAQSNTTANVSAAAREASAIDSTSMATIYVIRSTGHAASAVNLRVVVDNEMRCKVKNNRYAVLMVEPGTHSFNATSWDKPGTQEKFALKMPVEAGKTYYMSMHLKQKFMGIEIFLEEITYNTAAPLLAKYKTDGCD